MRTLIILLFLESCAHHVVKSTSGASYQLACLQGFEVYEKSYTAFYRLNKDGNPVACHVVDKKEDKK